MSVIDKVIAAVTPPESDEARREARARARAAAGPTGWLSLLIDHHVQIESAFQAVRQAQSADARLAAFKQLALILSAHSNAEEAVLYPALAHAHEKAHAVKAYTEQSAAKLQMGLLEYIDPMSQDFVEEENTWFIELTEKIGATDGRRLKDRYLDEFQRQYVGVRAPA
jgi:hypothetical protein